MMNNATQHAADKMNTDQMFEFLNGDRPVVLFDMDGVMANWQKMFDELLVQDYPHITPIPFNKITSFKTQSFYAPEHKDDIQEMLKTEGFYRDLDAYEGVVEVIHTLNKYVDVFLCTAPYVSHKTCASEKMEWVENHLGKEWKERMVITSDKTLVNGVILIDDKPNISGVMKPSWEHIVFDAPYNRHMPRRINHWSEGLEVVAATLKEIMGAREFWSSK